MERFPAFPHSGLARVIWFIGTLVAMAGGAIFALGLISFIADIGRALQSETAEPPDMEPFIRAVTVGFPVFAGGSLIAWLASTLSPPRGEPTHLVTDNRVYVDQPSSFIWSERDTTIHGGQHITATYSIIDARRDMQRLEAATVELGLPPRARSAVERTLTSARRELAKPDADENVIADRLDKVVRILDKVGALSRAGESVIGPLTRLATYLGPVGSGIFAML